MKKILYIILAIVLVSACAGNKEAKELFARVESVMDEHPDSALALLDRARTHKDAWSKAQRMRFELLHAKAQNKAYVDFTTDSVMKEVVEYYNSHGTANEKMEANYLLGCAYRDLGDSPFALKYMKDALSSDHTNHKNKSVIKQKSILCSQIGALLELQNMEKESIGYYGMALEYDQQLADSTNIAQDYLNIANLYRKEKDYSKAMFCCDTAEHFLGNMANDKDLSEVLNLKSLICCDIQEYHEALRHFSKIRDCYEDSKGTINSTGAFIYYNLNKYDSACIYWKKAIMHGNINVQKEAYGGLANIFMNLCKTDSTVFYLNRFVEAADSVERYTQVESVSKILKAYNYQHKERELKEMHDESVKKDWLIVVLSLSVSIVLLVSILILKRIRMHQLNSEVQLMRLQQWKDKQAVHADEYKSVTATTYSYDEEGINFFEWLDNKIENGNTLSAKEWAIIRKTIETASPLFFTTLNRMHLLNETEMQINMLIKLGISPNNIAKLICRDKSTVSVSRKRMYKKTFGSEGSPKEWDSYIRSL